MADFASLARVFAPLGSAANQYVYTNQQQKAFAEQQKYQQLQEQNAQLQNQALTTQNQAEQFELQKQQALQQYAKTLPPDQQALFMADPAAYFQNRLTQQSASSTAMAYTEMAHQEPDPKKKHAWQMAANAAMGGAPKDAVQSILKNAGITTDESLDAERQALAEQRTATTQQTELINNLLRQTISGGGAAGAPTGGGSRFGSPVGDTSMPDGNYLKGGHIYRAEAGKVYDLGPVSGGP